MLRTEIKYTLPSKFATLCVVVMLVVAETFAGTHNHIIRTYSQSSGLSHNKALCIGQDRDGFIWIGTADGINRFDGREFRKFSSLNSSYHRLGNSVVHAICTDSDNRMWVGTDDGVYDYNSDESFVKFGQTTRYGVVITGRVHAIVENTDGKIWIATESQGFFIYDPKVDTLIQNSSHSDIVNVLHPRGNGNMFVGSVSGAIAEFNDRGELLRWLSKNDFITPAKLHALHYANNVLWCGSETNGLTSIALGGNVDSERRNQQTRAQLPVKSLLKISDNNLLIGTDNGLFVFDTETNSFERINDRQGALHGINMLFKDVEGGVWIAGQYNGVSYMPRSLKYIEQRLSFEPHVGKRVVTSISEDRRGTIWIGTENSGIYTMDRDGQLTSSTVGGQQFKRVKTTLIDDKDRLWIGTPNDGLYLYDMARHTLKNYKHQPSNNNTINDNEIQTIISMGDDKVFVGTPWGLSKYDAQKDCFVQIKRVGNNLYVADFASDNNGNLWIASRNRGGIRYNVDTEQWSSFKFRRAQSRSGIPVSVCVYVDTKGEVWMGTEEGLFRFNRDDSTFEPYSVDGIELGKLSISSIEEDGNNRLWISSNGGVIALDTSRDSVDCVVNVIDGLQSDQFNANSSLYSSDHKLYFGSVNGFDVINPERIVKNTYLPPVYITSISINERPVDVSRSKNDGSPLKTTAQRTEQVKLKHNQNSIGFTFAALSYQASAKNRYAYKLEGVDHQWSYTNDNSAYYSNLPAGRYKFVVRGANDDGLFGDSVAIISIVVKPPFYLSAIAIMLYLMAFAATCWWFARWLAARNRKRMEEFTAHQEKITYKSKIDFFTNIAHEIRTPLSLINIPLESILKSSEEFSPKTRNYLKVIEKNVESLLDMVNQLLDLRKSEEIGVNLTLSRCNVSSFLGEICDRYEPRFEIQNIVLKREIPSNVNYSIDRDGLLKIVNNLLSNALKYCEKEVVVTLADRGNGFEVTVTNDGRGVRDEDKELIFNTFFQSEGSKTGTGIGLPLAKLFAEKMDGKIWCENRESGGVTFFLFIPQHQTDVAELNADTQDGQPEAVVAHSNVVVDDDMPTILVVEDNAELNKVICELLEPNYKVLSALNGKEALTLMVDNSCNLIVSDIMMPEMDGYELCEAVKSDMKYSHIPIIQLTAKASIEDKIRGLENGADAYIEKPFAPDHLLAQIDSLLQNRLRIRKALLSSDTTKQSTKNIGLSKKDTEFVEKLNAEIEAQIQNEDFYIEELAESMFMSRSNFYRKIKSMFGISPNDYLKKYRLRRAAELIKSGDYLIKEIYEQVGFKTSSYFSACFKEEYGLPPKQYQDKLQNNENE